MRRPTVVHEPSTNQDDIVALSMLQALVAGIPAFQLTDSALEFLKGKKNIRDFLHLDQVSPNYEGWRHPQHVSVVPLPPLNTLFGQLVAVAIQLYHEEANKCQ
eukprot:Protomagalhaensia_sp_Gyna_25__1054@NODE_1509_length_1773_cov_267_797001_g1224_i0_p4_GENE_NODE_1509_length_1773_cov_267_797001_g1224_i0NODE_1509_length_1773_cov_267_797001_g1224_i0_p4_ORF_typecomplete_len103_score21_11_NODE_1509_length_1773_cov_267_797001_g1224_i013041612